MATASIDTSTPRLCVYTVMIGGYEQLIEQPVARQSGMPFICLTDDASLGSETWQVRPVQPVCRMDPIRSQREIKIRPHVYLPEFDASLYIDNSVLLKETPESVFERYWPESGLALPAHSYRDSVLDEFLEVSRMGLDDQSRIFEQLNHYAIDCPDVLQMRPLWTAILLRNHRDSRVREMLEIWIAHVLRYSRRDQLSIHAALSQANLQPNLLEIDNFASWFHSWPHHVDRGLDRGTRRPAVSFSPPVARIRQLEQDLADLTAQHAAETADLTKQRDAALRRAQQSELLLAQRTAECEWSRQTVKELGGCVRLLQKQLSEAERQCETIKATRSWRAIKSLMEYRDRHPHAARLIRCATTLLLRVLDAGRREVSAAHDSPANGSADYLVDAGEVKRSQGGGTEHAFELGPPRAMIYVDPTDERGRALVQLRGDANPPTLRMWRRLLSSESFTHVVDVGANYGEMLVNVDLPPEAKIIAVEPNPRVLPYLKLTLAQAGLDAAVVESAVDEREGSGLLLVDSVWSGRTRLARGVGTQAPELEAVAVQTTTLAALLGGGSADGMRALVKIDVEGHEADVLKGGMAIINKMDSFVGLVEVLHLDEEDIEWILNEFDVEMYDMTTDQMVRVEPGTLAHFSELAADERFYSQDVVVRPKRGVDEVRVTR